VVCTRSEQGEGAAMTGGGRRAAVTKREGLTNEKTSFRQKIPSQNGGHLESASWRLEVCRRRAAGRGRGQLLALSRSSGPALDLDGLSASQPGGGLRPVKPIRPKT
jgi:hypothetical protein